MPSTIAAKCIWLKYEHEIETKKMIDLQTKFACLGSFVSKSIRSWTQNTITVINFYQLSSSMSQLTVDRDSYWFSLRLNSIECQKPVDNPQLGTFYFHTESMYYWCKLSQNVKLRCSSLNATPTLLQAVTWKINPAAKIPQQLS